MTGIRTFTLIVWEDAESWPFKKLKTFFFQNKKLLHDEWIKYLKRASDPESQDFAQIQNYYMERKFRRYIQIDRKKIEQRKDGFNIGKKEENFIVVHTEGEFKEKCLNNPENKIIHFLIEIKDNKSSFSWQKSSGPTSSLDEYLIKNEECEESIAEGERTTQVKPSFMPRPRSKTKS